MCERNNKLRRRFVCVKETTRCVPVPVPVSVPVPATVRVRVPVPVLVLTDIVVCVTVTVTVPAAANTTALLPLLFPSPRNVLDRPSNQVPIRVWGGASHQS